MSTERRMATMANLLAVLMLAGTPLLAAGEKADKKTPTVPPVPPAPGATIPDPPSGLDMPGVPKPTKPPSTTPRYHLKAGETHKGDLYFMSESVTIAGKQRGDLMVFGREINVSGEVTGDINATVETARLSGTMGDAVRVFCGDLTVSGTIEGDLIAVCGSIQVEKGSHIKGDVNAKGADIEILGDVDGEVEATGGEVRLAGKVGGDATLKADVVEVEDETRVAGDLSYTSRSEIEIDDPEVAGEVIYTPGERKPPVSKGGFFKWFFFMATAMLAGLGALAIFRKSAPAIVGAVAGDGLRSAGVGFITAIVVPVAAALSCIFIITIPAAVLALLAYCLVLYLAQVPVAVWLGEVLLKRMGRGGGSPFIALTVGIPVLYVAFSIPFLGTLALFAVIFTGFGAIVITIWAARQARRAGGGSLPPQPPAVPAVA